MNFSELPAAKQTALEAAAFRRLMAHLSMRTDVQNIDLMNLAGFCRNCLGNWLSEEAQKAGDSIDRNEGRAHVYGMPYEDWKKLHQKEASAAQQQAFDASAAHKH